MHSPPSPRPKSCRQSRLSGFKHAAFIYGALVLAMSTPAISGTGISTPSSNEPIQRPAAFLQCAACHSTVSGKNGVGPSLAGVYGRKAGTATGYAYSAALKGADIEWNAATLDQWIAGPSKMVPGNKMPFMGLADAGKRAAIIAYLKSLK